MKAVLALVLVAVLVALMPAPVQGQGSVSLDHVLYAWDGGTEWYLCTGTYVIFKLRLTNDTPNNITGLVNGFRVYSPSGVQWNTTIGSWAVDAYPEWFDLSCGVSHIGVTGSGADTVGFFGSRIIAPGIPQGFDSIAFIIAVGPIDDSQGGHVLCLDSSFYPPGGNWTWYGGGSHIPAWSGPHCFEILVIPCLDTDGDGVYDGCDNCEQTYNPSQSDSDWDGIGDACETCCINRGDVDHSGGATPIDIADLVYLTDYMFAGGPDPPCLEEADVDGSSMPIDIADLVYLVDYMFAAGPPPPPCR